ADLRALVAGQPAHRVQHRVVLGGRYQHPAAVRAVVPAGPEQALHRQVVRLGSAACEDHLAGPGAERLGDLLPGLLHHPAGPAAGVVQRRGVAEAGEFVRHGRDGLGDHRRGRRVVQIDQWVRVLLGCAGGPRLACPVGVVHDKPQPSWTSSPVPGPPTAPDQDPWRRAISSVSCGTTLNRSPTTPKSASSKIGASGSLLITMMVLDVCMPARCWIAPEMPTARYNCGDTVLPVWPTWNWCGYQPSSVAARDAPTAAPSRSARPSIRAKFSALPTPRPPDTTMDASVSSGRSLRSWATRSVMCAPLAASLSSTPTGSSAAAPGDASGGTAFGRTATIGMPLVTLDFTMMAPPKMDCSATGPPSPGVRSTASVSTPE